MTKKPLKSNALDEEVDRLRQRVAELVRREASWREAEAALRTSEERFAVAFRTFPLATVLTRLKDGKVLDVNPAFERLSGYRREDIVGRSTVELGIWGEAPNRDRLVEALKMDGAVRDLEVCMYPRDGEERRCRMAADLVEVEGEACVVASADDITERTRTEAALRVSEERFRTLVENVHEVIYAHGRDKILTYLSPQCKEVIGYAPEELIGRPWTAIVSNNPINREVLESDEPAPRSRRPLESRRVEILTKEGRPVLLVISERPRLDAAGHVVGVVGSARDITEEVRTQEKLRESAQKLEDIVEHIEEVIFSVSADGTVPYISPRVSQWGYEPKEVSGKSFADFIHPQDLERVTSTFQTTLQTGVELPVAFRLRTKGGSYTRVEGTGRAIWQGEQIVVLHGTMRDISARLEMERALEESEKRFRFLFEHAPDAYYLADLQGVLIDCNRAAEELLRRPRSELIGQNVLTSGWVRAEDLGKVADLISRPAQGEMAGPEEVKLHRAEGTPVHVEVRVAAVPLGEQDYVLGVARDITDRHNTMLALRDSEARLRAILSTSPDVTLMLDEDGRYREILTGSPGLLQGPPEELLGRLRSEVLPKEMAERGQQVIRQALATGEIQTLEYPLQVQAGLRWFESRVAPLAITLDGKRCVIWVARDVTLRKELGDALEERAQQLGLVNQIARGLVTTLEMNALLEHAAHIIHSSFDYHQVCVFLREGDEMVLRANAGRFAHEMPANHRLPLGTGMVGWVGQTGEALLARDVQEEPRFYNPLRHNRLRSAITVPITWADEVLGVLDVESEELDAFDVNDAQLLDTLADQLAIAIHNARLYEELAAHSEILERLVEERTLELRRSAERVEAILANSPDAIVFLGPQGSIQSGNRAFETLFGYPAETVIGQLPTMLLAPAHVPRLVEAIDRTVAQNRPVRFEAVAERENGDWFDADVALGPIEGDGVAGGVVCSLRDISALKQVERMKDAFVSNVSHELRTPITSLRLNTGLLRMDPANQGTYLERLTREVDRLGVMIEDLLRLSRLDQGRVRLDLKAVDLNVLVAQYIEDRNPLAESQGLRLEFQPGRDLPCVSGDSGMLGQVISILLNNAISYTPGGGKITVCTLARKEGGGSIVGFRVTDNGPGIGAEDLPHVFERFFRGKVGRDSGTPGAGLGLSIAKEIVDRHRGQIELKSPVAEGKGAAFTVWLPTRDVEEVL